MRTETGFARGHQERALGRIPLHSPASVIFEYGGVVGSICDGQRAFEFRSECPIDWEAVISLNGPMWRVPRTFKRHATAGGNHHADRHLVLGQRAGLIG